MIIIKQVCQIPVGKMAHHSKVLSSVVGMQI